jgi:hypothetical protein
MQLMPSVEDALRSQVRNIEAKYGRPISGWIDLVRVHGLTKHGEILALLNPDLARKARSWFDGRNPAGAAVYDRANGRVADGLDDGHLNDRSGAEANITAGLALLDDPSTLSAARSWTGAWPA